MKASQNNRRRHPRGRHHRHHHYGIGEDYVFIQDDIESLRPLFRNFSDLDWAIRLIQKEGPEHVQITASLIAGLVAKIFKYIDVKSIPLETVKIVGTGHGHREYGFEYPIELPEIVLEMTDEDLEEEVIEYVGEGPLEATALDLLLLNALSVILKHLEKNDSNDNTQSDEK